MHIRPFLVALSMTIILAPRAGAQWQTNGTNVYYNGGIVGIAITAPLGQLMKMNVEHLSTMK